MEPTTGAILVVGHFIVSVFQYQLGNPVFQKTSYPTMEICQQYAAELRGEFKLDNEFTMYKQANCITVEDWNKEMRRRQELQNQQLQKE